MNYHKQINIVRLLVFTSFIGFVSCEMDVMFHEALPPKVELINAIPETFQGVYLCESDSSLIYANENVIYRESYFTFITSVHRVRETENCSIVAGGLYLPGRKECVPFEYIDENTIIAKVYSIDTLFSFSNQEAMKLYKGALFVNYENAKNEWVSFMISPIEGDKLKWEIIDVPSKIKNIKAITHEYKEKRYKDDHMQYILKPTLVEFERILERKHITQFDILIPVNPEMQWKVQ